MESYSFQRGDTPVLLSLPHTGALVPPDVAAGLTDAALAFPTDIDHHLDRLFHFAPALGIGFIKAMYRPVVIDLDRDAGSPGGDDPALWKPGHVPDNAEVQRRIALYWHPYHARIRQELDALKERFGVAVLLDAHSIPWCPMSADFRLGTWEGGSAAPALVSRLMNVLTAHERFSAARDGRAGTGAIAAAFGRPVEGIHAIQLDLCRRTFMDEAPPAAFRPDLVTILRPSLERLLAVLVEWAWENARRRRYPLFP
jgi:N-formylglutamate amidohydrolase